MNKHTMSVPWLLPIAGALAAVSFAIPAFGLTMITSSLDLGARGANVTYLQQFLATDTTVYPEGLVTGYYGSLTQAAVQRFQCKQSIVCSGTAASTGYGRVGPRTLAAINAMIGGSGTSDVSAPVMSRPVVSTTTTSATVTWTTNEAARGTLYYSTLPLPVLEASASTGVVVGGQATTEAGLGFNHSLSVTGLQPSTWYYYAIASVDASGNVMLTWPTTFRTGI